MIITTVVGNKNLICDQLLQLFYGSWKTWFVTTTTIIIIIIIIITIITTFSGEIVVIVFSRVAVVLLKV